MDQFSTMTLEGSINNLVTKKLSFCIPTYNRAEMIPKCLDSIINQDPDDFEIVIVDGGSSDKTSEIIKEYQRRYVNIKYFSRKKNVGVDLDILKAIELAQSEYCWLMSDDDQLEEGAIQYLLSQLEKHRNIAGTSVNYEAYDVEMKHQVRAIPAASGNSLNTDFFFNDAHECFSILGVHFGYLSGQVINRRLWLDVVSEQKDLEQFYNGWLMVYIIGNMVRKKAEWLYIHRKCVKYRSGNDSFKSRVGVYNRQLIAHVEFEKILSALFDNKDRTYTNVMHTILFDRMPRNLAVIKADGASIYLQWRLTRLYLGIYRRYFVLWWKVLPIFFVPNFVLNMIRRLYFWHASRQPTTKHI